MPPHQHDGRRTVYIVDGMRTPFIKAEGRPGPFSPVDLAVQCGRPLLLRQNFDASQVDQVILGCVSVVADEMNPARLAALRLGMGNAMTAYTVQINCGSGMQSIECGYRAIQDGSSDIVLAGGAEALSHAPLLYSRPAVDWFADLSRARSLKAKLAALGRFRPGYLKPVLGLLRGLTDPIVNMNMGQTAELLAYLFDISRTDADAYAARSHQRLAAAWEQGSLDSEVNAAVSPSGDLYERDNGLRPDSTPESLARLKPVFEKPWGKVTAGNSSQITDGASWIILASEKAVEMHQLSPIARIADSHWSALNPSIMGLGPVLSSTELLKRHGGMDNIDLWEINEAFAAQVLACCKAWQSPEFCRDVLGLDEAAGAPDIARLNVDGGAISLGHPVGTSGNRIVLHLANSLQRLKLKRGIATLCIGGGQGGAMLLETP